MTAKATEQEAHLEEMAADVRETKRGVHRAREELGSKRNHRIAVEENFTTTLERAVNKKVANALKRACLEAEEERERKRKRRFWKRPSKQLQPSIWPQKLSGSLRPTVSRKGLKTSRI